jgi:tetratricopeptide (TPR) repeat protein
MLGCTVPTGDPKKTAATGDARRKTLIAGALVALTLVVFARTLGNGFVDYDDNQYVTINPTVQEGVTIDGFAWAFTTRTASNWHPVTWLSHMLDVSVFGVKPWGHHFTNILFHAANVALLFFALELMTQAVWRSALAAALFAVHPLHVESVAWVAERKDVLSTFFGLLSLLAYVRWVHVKSSPRRTAAVAWVYFAALGCFGLSLMAKPMLVTWPCVLLLFDVWPLERLRFTRAAINRTPIQQQPSFVTLLVEKVPFFALSIASSAMTLWAQHEGGVVASLQRVGLEHRVFNAIVAYAAYLWRTIWPFDLAVVYPHPGHWPASTIVASVAALALLTILACLLAMRRRPAFMVGWLFYLGTLVPVIGLVQVGSQAFADRYTYVPLIGVFIMIAWSLSARGYRLTAAASAAVIVALSGASIAQIGHWRDTVSLFEHAIASTDRNYIAHVNLSFTWAKQSQFERAARHFSKALAINPLFARDNDFLGRELIEQRRWNDARAHYEELMRIFPEHATVRANLAGVHASESRELIRQGRPADAVAPMRLAVEFQPNDAEFHRDLGLALAASGELEQAIQALQAALRINPDDSLAQEILRTARQQRGRGPER